MIYELRTYRLKPGRLTEYLAFFEIHGFPILSRYAEAVGFWYSGPTETGVLEEINHIWGYESLEARLRQRVALYQDPAWTRELVPVVMEMFLRLNVRLMRLKPESEPALREAMARPGDRGPVVATFLPSGLPMSSQPSIGHWEMLTGVLGGGFALDYLDDAQIDAPLAYAGSERQIWRPARFSRIR